jgi:hypothetical protein
MADDGPTWGGGGRRGRGSDPGGDSNTRSAAWRDRHEIIGGYSYQPPNQSGPPIGGLSPASAMFDEPVDRFDPYRGGDLTRILQNQVQRGNIDDLQLALIRAGLLDEGDIVLGYADDQTEDAFRQVLALANQNAMDWRDVMSQVAQGAFGNIGPGGGAQQELPPTIITLPNRDDVVAAAEATGMELTGHRLDDDLQGTVADNILNALRTHQERQYQAELGMTTGLHFTEDAPDPARLLEEQVRERAPNLVAERGAQNARDIWFEGLGGPV